MVDLVINASIIVDIHYKKAYFNLYISAWYSINYKPVTVATYILSDDICSSIATTRVVLNKEQHETSTQILTNLNGIKLYIRKAVIAQKFI